MHDALACLARYERGVWLFYKWTLAWLTCIGLRPPSGVSWASPILTPRPAPLYLLPSHTPCVIFSLALPFYSPCLSPFPSLTCGTASYLFSFPNSMRSVLLFCSLQNVLVILHRMIFTKQEHFDQMQLLKSTLTFTQPLSCRSCHHEMLSNAHRRILIYVPIHMGPRHPSSHRHVLSLIQRRVSSHMSMFTYSHRHPGQLT